MVDETGVFERLEDRSECELRNCGKTLLKLLVRNNVMAGEEDVALHGVELEDTDVLLVAFVVDFHERTAVDAVKDEVADEGMGFHGLGFR